jgi:predicted DNA-binding WGR domain protein
MYLHKNEDDHTKFWKIEISDCQVNILYGKSANKGRQIKKNFDNKLQAFKYYRRQIHENLQNGYESPENKIHASDFDDNTFNHYIENREFEKAVDWINLLGEFSELSYEEKLINALLLDNKQIDAERFIFGKIKNCTNLLIVVRQIRNLSSMNPLMSRMMIGNLPAKPQNIDLIEYYTNFAIAQSRMGMIDAAETTLLNIVEMEVKIIYLANLLDTHHMKSDLQAEILNKALSLIEKITLNNEKMSGLLILLSKGARNINQNQLAVTLFESAQKILS